MKKLAQVLILTAAVISLTPGASGGLPECDMGGRWQCWWNWQVVCPGNCDSEAGQCGDAAQQTYAACIAAGTPQAACQADLDSSLLYCNDQANVCRANCNWAYELCLPWGCLY
jgi:hypothetical protein